MAKREGEQAAEAPPRIGQRLLRALPLDDAAWPTAAPVVRYGGTLAAVLGVTGALWMVHEGMNLLSSSLVYLVLVIGATVLGGRRAGMLAAVAGFLLFDFVLVPPYLDVALGDLAYLPLLLVFAGVAILLSELIAGAQEQALHVRRHAADVSRLYELSQAIIRARHRDQVLPAIASKIVTVFHAQFCWILLPDGAGRLAVQAAAPSAARPPTPGEMSVAEWAFRHGGAPGPQGRPQSSLDEQVRDGRTAFVPLCAGGQTRGLLIVADKIDRRPFTPAERTLLATFADQAVVALERLALLHEADRAEMLARTDELKSALMAAVSHDLRTPLTSIITSVTSLLEPGMRWDAETQRDLLEGIYDESLRLNRLVGNLLDMSRIEGGALHPVKDWYAIDEIIENVLERMEPRLAMYPVTVDVAAGIPLVLMDFMEIDQVLTNLLENATKYTPPGTPITVTAWATDGILAVRVADQGPGVAATDVDHLFDKFFRAAESNPATGVGLGLAICKGLIAAHAGQIWAVSQPGAGLEIIFTLPITEATPLATVPAPPAAAEKVTL